MTLAPLSGCEQFSEHRDTFAQALSHMCEFHRLSIVQVLLTEQQRRAGEMVCNAIGLHLGS